MFRFKVRNFCVFQTFASTVASTSALLLIMGPESIYYIFPSRVLGGLAHGVVYLTVLIHACEVSVPRLRGMVVSSVHLCLFVGVFMTSSSLLPVEDTKSYEFDPTKAIGINGLICILSGMVIAIFYNLESPVYLIKKYQEEKAVDIMIQLRSESHETAEVRRDFNEFKLMAIEDTKTSVNIFDRQNLWPLLVVFMLKTIFVASFNLPLNLEWLEATETDLYDGQTDPSGMCLSGTRWIVIMVAMFVIDLRRMKIYLTSIVVCSIALFTAVYVIDANIEEPNIIKALAFVFQAFSGLGVGVLADIYATEAFNTKKKPFSIAFLSILEYGLQILLVVDFFYFDFPLVAVMGAFGAVMTLGLLAIFIPDTSNLSLRNARNRFCC